MNRLLTLLTFLLFVGSCPMATGQEPNIENTIKTIKSKMGEVNPEHTSFENAKTNLDKLLNAIKSQKQNKIKSACSLVKKDKATLEQANDDKLIPVSTQYTILTPLLDALVASGIATAPGSTTNSKTQTLAQFKAFKVGTTDAKNAFKEKLQSTLTSQGKDSEFAKAVYKIAQPFYTTPKPSVPSKTDSINNFTKLLKTNTVLTSPECKTAAKQAFKLIDIPDSSQVKEKLLEFLNDTTVTSDQIVRKTVKEKFGFNENPFGFDWYYYALFCLMIGLLASLLAGWLLKREQLYFRLKDPFNVVFRNGEEVNLAYEANKSIGTIKVSGPDNFSATTSENPLRFTPPAAGLYTFTPAENNSGRYQSRRNTARPISIAVKFVEAVPAAQPVVSGAGTGPKTDSICLTPQRNAGKYIFAETFVTAGPRKTNSDNELGEDVAGVLVHENYALFWIFDGVSNYDILATQQGNEYLSSRLYAQTIAWNVQQKLASAMKIQGELSKCSLQDLLVDAAEDALKELEQKIQTMLTAHPDELSRLRGRDFMVATTATLGYLDKQGNLRAVNLGDNKLLLVLHPVSKTWYMPTFSVKTPQS